jgi:hypothetical protein
MTSEKHVDESWKDSMAEERSRTHEDGQCGCGGDSCDGHHEEAEVSFLNYIMSMGYQAMIFLGEVPHPATGNPEKNIRQAKFLIDTLAVLKEKTKGNLDPQEESLLSASLYELQMKYVEISQKESEGPRIV